MSFESKAISFFLFLSSFSFNWFPLVTRERDERDERDEIDNNRCWMDLLVIIYDDAGNNHRLSIQWQ